MIHLSVETDFTFSNEKIGDYYTGVRRVLAKIFGNREILAYVTATEKEHGTNTFHCCYIRYAGILKQATMNRKRSGLFVTIWCEAAKGLKCWSI